MKAAKAVGRDVVCMAPECVHTGWLFTILLVGIFI